MEGSGLTLAEKDDIVVEVWPMTAEQPPYLRLNRSMLVSAALELTPDEVKRIHLAANRIKAAKRTPVAEAVRS